MLREIDWSVASAETRDPFLHLFWNIHSPDDLLHILYFISNELVFSIQVNSSGIKFASDRVPGNNRTEIRIQESFTKNQDLFKVSCIAFDSIH